MADTSDIVPEKGQLEDPKSSANTSEIETGDEAPVPMDTVRRRIVMFSLCLALFLSALDVTIEYAWIGSSYTLSNTASVAIWAKLSDIFGRKPIIMIANVAFLLGSLLAGLSQNVGMLIGGRIIQGLGAGGCTVLVTILISDLFALRDRAKYYGLTGIVYAISSSIGPVLGGVFTQTIGWRWCFYINLPFDGISLIALLLALRVHTSKTTLAAGLKSLDWIGCLLIVGGTICFLYGLGSGAGDKASWKSAETICLLVFGVVILVLFGFYESRFATSPLVPMRIFSRGTNIASMAVLCLHGFVFIAYDYFLPLYFQIALGFAPIISGVSLLALVVPLSFTTMGAAFFIKKTGSYLLPTNIGAAVMTLGTGLLISLGAKTDWAKIMVFQVIVGLGAGPLFQAPMIALQAHLPQKDVAAASSASQFLRSLSTSMSIVIGTVLLQANHGGNQLTEAVSTPEAAQGYVDAMKYMWIFYTAMAGVMVATCMFIKKMPVQDKS
ncbi:unnamed protein product [Parascedosporium putredinis]|uniref:Major facilitator superfamily (MFS) profile domain-containing protein n=1 Tax=Parascedosporium putredinis TaxID=1442378 RepID=A0A9P1MA61_9PEZI|nr:unnamed protein product [Parascedosporium putredinis]CAI7996871.1 unnamed protein product [Parascedosporium putredinis]